MDIKNLLEEREELQYMIDAKIKIAISTGKIPSAIEGLEELLNTRSRLMNLITNSGGELAS